MHRIGRCRCGPLSAPCRALPSDRAILLSGDEDEDGGDVVEMDEWREGVVFLDRLPIVCGGTGVAIDQGEI